MILATKHAESGREDGGGRLTEHFYEMFSGYLSIVCHVGFMK